MNDTWRYKLELAPPSLQVRFCLYSYLDFLPPFLCPSCPSLSSHSSQSSSLCVVPSLSPPPFWLPASIPSFFSRSRYLNAPRPPSHPPLPSSLLQVLAAHSLLQHVEDIEELRGRLAEEVGCPFPSRCACVRTVAPIPFPPYTCKSSS